MRPDQSCWPVLGGGLTLFLCGCASAPEPLPPPAVAVTARVYAGDPLRGVFAEVPNGSPTGISLQAMWVEAELPTLPRVGEVARSVMAPGLAAPFVVDADRLASLRVATGAAAASVSAAALDGRLGRRGEQSSMRVGVVPGASVAFTVTDATPSFELHVSRQADGALLVFLVTPSTDAAMPSRCVLLADALVPSGAPLALVEGAASGPSLLWLLQAEEVQDEELSRSIAQQLTAAAAAARQAPAFDPQVRRQQVAATALGFSWTRRRALLQLAHTHGAELTADLALLAEPPLLAAIATEVTPALAAPMESAAFGWLLEKSSIGAVVVQLQSGALPPEILSAAQRHLGVTVGGAGSLLRAVRRCATRSEFATWLRAEHELSLEDARPATRVRAYDWLAARQFEPAGYDPLAAKAARRVALAKKDASQQ